MSASSRHVKLDALISRGKQLRDRMHEALKDNQDSFKGTNPDPLALQFQIEIRKARLYRHKKKCRNLFLIIKIGLGLKVHRVDSLVHDRDCAYFHFRYGTSLELTASNLELLNQNYVIIEVWNCKGKADEFIGLVKLPLHTYYLAYRTDPTPMLQSEYPVISHNSDIAIIHPVDSREQGTVEVLLAIGSASQVKTLNNRNRAAFLIQRCWKRYRRRWKRPGKGVSYKKVELHVESPKEIVQDTDPYLPETPQPTGSILEIHLEQAVHLPILNG